MAEKKSKTTSKRNFSKGDFVEISFTGKLKDSGQVFNSNVKAELEKANLPANEQKTKPFVFALGEDMFLKAIDEHIQEKGEVGKEFTLELEPERAFGKRKQDLIQVMSMKLFKQHGQQPVPGMVFNFDNKMGKILSASGGRVIVDFNNPIAGKDVVYKVKVTKKIQDQETKVKSLMDFFFRTQFDFEIKGKKLIIKLKEEQKPFEQFIEMFKDKFKEMVGLDVEIQKQEKKKETKTKK